MKKEQKIVGIDLGTTNSCISYLDYNQKEPIVIKNRDSGADTTPSAVYVKDKNNIIVGEEALQQSIIEPDRVFTSIKRKMGENFSKKIDGVNYTPELVSSLILKKLARSASDFLTSQISECVITVPAYFTENQRVSTKNAAILAGLKAVRIINEPTAAALYYFANKLEKNSKVLVYDLGGGTFDITILEASGNLVDTKNSRGVIKVLSTSGDNKLGGDDFDNVILSIIKQEVKSSLGYEIKDVNLLARFLSVAREAKEKLSFSNSFKINIPFITSNFNYSRIITRSEFENRSKFLMDKCAKSINNALTAAKLTVSDISQILLVGGSTRIPAVKKQVIDLFGKEPNTSLDPDCVVAKGAAIQGAILSERGLTQGGHKKNIVLVDVIPFSLGINSEFNRMVTLIPNNTPIPATKTEIFTNAADYQPACEIEVYQGQHKFVDRNHKLGSFTLPLRPCLKGRAVIEVTMKVDVNSLLSITAKDKATNVVKNINIKMSRDLSKEQIKEMFEQAKKFEKSEQEKENRVKAFNELDGIFYSLKDLVNNKKERKTPEDLCKEIEDFINPIQSEIQQLRLKIDEDILEDIKKIKSKLETFSRDIFNKLQSSQNTTPTNNDNMNSSNNSENKKDFNDSNNSGNTDSFEDIAKEMDQSKNDSEKDNTEK